MLAFELQIPHGHLVGWALPGPETPVSFFAGLHPDEASFAQSLAPRRRIPWIGGRLALRAAIGCPGLAPIGTTPRGGPLLPAGWTGSISHKDTIAVGLASPSKSHTVGVDVEVDRPLVHDIARLILTARELEEIAPLAPEPRAREVLLRFSAKESIYKALDPYVGRYVGFAEAEVTPLADGTAKVALLLRDDEDPSKREGPFEVDVRWFRRDGLILTSARILRSELL